MTRTRNTVLVLVAVSLALILWDLRASEGSVRTAVQQVVTPLQRTVTAAFAPFGAWARHTQEFADPVVRAERAAPIAAQAPPGWSTSPARVVAADIAGDRAVVTIDAGDAEGVRSGNAVLAPGGLVGEVTRVSPHAATVRLVADPASTIGVRVLPSKEIGVASGTGVDADVRLDLLSPAAAVAAGDTVVTLGSTERDGIPADLPLGRIRAVDTLPTASGRVAQAQPVAGVTSLETVVVLTERS